MNDPATVRGELRRFTRRLMLVCVLAGFALGLAIGVFVATVGGG